MAPRPKSQFTSRRNRIVPARRGHATRYHTTKTQSGRSWNMPGTSQSQRVVQPLQGRTTSRRVLQFALVTGGGFHLPVSASDFGA